MSLDTQLEFDFRKKEPEPSYSRLRRALKDTAIIVGSIAAIPVGLYAILMGGGLALAAATGTEIVGPWTPPRVEVSSNAIRVESRGYTGPHLTKWYDGGTKIEWFQPDMHLDLFNDFPEYVDRNGDGLVDSVRRVSWTGPEKYDREKNDAVKYPDVFARANREFKKVLDKYQPYITLAERSIF